MGVKGINEILKKRYPENFMNVKLEALRNKSVAIDSNNVIYPFYTKAYLRCVNDIDAFKLDVDVSKLERLFVENLLTFIGQLRSLNIKMVWVWDGKTRQAKKETVDKRVEKMKTCRDKIKECREKIDSLDDDPLERLHIDESLMNEYRKLMSANIGIKFELIEKAKEIVKNLGFITLQAEHDGEKLCADLQISKKVDMVWTTDTDVYVTGATVVCSGFEGFKNEDDKRHSIVKVAFLKDIYEELNVRDLCILLGNDFNTNIKNYGPVKCEKLIKDYGSIENITHLDTSCLNYEECLEIFQHKEYEDNLEDEDYDLYELNIYDILKEYSIPDYIRKTLY